VQLPDPVIPVSGSELPRLAGQNARRRTDRNAVHRVTLHLEHAEPLPSNEELHQRALSDTPHLTHEEFEARHGLADEALEVVESFTEHYGLRVTHTHPSACTVTVEGTTTELERAFGVELVDHEHRHGAHRGYEGAVHLPEAVAEVVQHVTGLDSREELFRPFAAMDGQELPEVPSHAPIYYPIEVAELYDFPEGDGEGQTIGIFEFSGGYNTKDLETYFSSQNIPMPDVTSVLVGKGKNEPYSPDNAFRETNLDIQTAGSIAPAAKYVIYLADQSAGILDLLNASVFDARSKPTILSISFGGAEGMAPASYWQAADLALKRAAALGITVCVSSGDGGSATQYYRQCGSRGTHVNYPASSPHVLACGGTSLHAKGGKIIREEVWNDLDQARSATGGGVSTIFPRPAWQGDLELPVNATPGVTFRGRGVPDVAGNADPMTGYKVMVDGKLQRIGGTSAVAPLWAGLIARMNQGLGKNIGFINHLLYKVQGKGLVNMTEGSNGAYRAGPGWNACTGLGRPDGKKLYAAIRELLTPS
jgi:kumamolisin